MDCLRSKGGGKGSPRRRRPLGRELGFPRLELTLDGRRAAEVAVVIPGTTAVGAGSRRRSGEVPEEIPRMGDHLARFSSKDGGQQRQCGEEREKLAAFRRPEMPAGDEGARGVGRGGR